MRLYSSGLETEHKHTSGGTAEDAESAEENKAGKESGGRNRRWTRMNASAGETAEAPENAQGEQTAEDAESAEGIGAGRESAGRNRTWTRMNAEERGTAENAEGRRGGKRIRDGMNRMDAEATRTAEKEEERGRRDKPRRAQGEETVATG